MPAPHTPLTNNYLFHIPPRNNLRGEHICVGDGRQLPTRISVLPPGQFAMIMLPEITPQPRVFIEYTLHAGPDSPLANYPESVSGFRPLTGPHLKSYQSWFTGKGFKTAPDDALFIWQKAIAPCEHMREIFAVILELNIEANKIGHNLAANANRVANLFKAPQ